ncbi:MAG: HEAT repeat domain-containing protein [PVC group bacterium]
MNKRSALPEAAPAPLVFRARLCCIVLFFICALLPGCGGREDEEDVVNYISDLSKEDFLQRMAAAKELSNRATGNDVVAVPYLVMSLQDSKELIGRYSAQALGTIRDYSSIPALITGSQEGSDYVRYDCVVALGRFNDPRVHGPLLNALQDESFYVRWAAAEALGNLKVPAAYAKLIAGLNDESSYVRSASATALGKLGDKGAVPYLRNSIYNPNLWVRNDAALALARLGDTEGIPVLIVNLSSAARDKKGVVREQAVQFLREITGKNFGFDPSDPLEVRKAAIKRWEQWWDEQQKKGVSGR